MTVVWETSATAQAGGGQGRPRENSAARKLRSRVQLRLRVARARKGAARGEETERAMTGLPSTTGTCGTLVTSTSPRMSIIASYPVQAALMFSVPLGLDALDSQEGSADYLFLSAVAHASLSPLLFEPREWRVASTRAYRCLTCMPPLNT